MLLNGWELRQLFAKVPLILVHHTKSKFCPQIFRKIEYLSNITRPLENFEKSLGDLAIDVLKHLEFLMFEAIFSKTIDNVLLKPITFYPKKNLIPKKSNCSSKIFRAIIKCGNTLLG